MEHSFPQLCFDIRLGTRPGFPSSLEGLGRNSKGSTEQVDLLLLYLAWLIMQM